VANGLARGVDRPNESCPEDHSVESQLQQLEQPNARIPGLPDGMGKRVLKLPLTHIVLGSEALLFDQLLLISAYFAPRRRTMLAWRVGSPLHHPGSLWGECDAELPRQLNFGSTAIHERSPVRLVRNFSKPANLLA